MARFVTRYARPMRIGFIAAIVVAATGVARADQAAPQTPVSAVRGEIARVVDVPLGKAAHVVLVEWTEVAQDDPPAQLPSWSVLVPFDPKTCARYYAVVADAAAWKPGDETRGVFVSADRPGGSGATTLPWCPIQLDGQAAGSLPALGDLARAEGDAIVPGLAALYAFFGADQTPLDYAMEGAYKELESAEALQLALDHHAYQMAAWNYAWTKNPANFELVDRAVWAATEPDWALLKLYWQLSPTRAAARVREEHAKDPARALAVIGVDKWDELIDLEMELDVPVVLWSANERAKDFLVAARARTTDAGRLADIDQQLAAFDRRAKLGVTDARSLAAYLRSHPDDRDLFTGMRLETAGPSDVGCDLRFPQLDVVAACDAESLQRSFQVADGTPVIVSGTVDSVYVGTDGRVEIRLAYAHQVVSAAPAPAIDAGVTPPPEQPRRKPKTPRDRDGDGGCCDAGGDGDAGVIAIALVAWIALRRRAWA